MEKMTRSSARNFLHDLGYDVGPPSKYALTGMELGRQTRGVAYRLFLYKSAPVPASIHHIFIDSILPANKPSSRSHGQQLLRSVRCSVSFRQRIRLQSLYRSEGGAIS